MILTKLLNCYLRYKYTLFCSYEAHAHVGCLDRNIFWEEGEEYSGQIVEFGKKAMTKYSLFHELLHACGLEHEHQRADVTQFVDYEAEHIKEIWGRDGN
jgi:hypothetical protein